MNVQGTVVRGGFWVLAFISGLCPAVADPAPDFLTDCVSNLSLAFERVRMRTHRLLTVPISLTLALSTADGANGSQDRIGFGFDKLRWGMTQHDVNALYRIHPGMTYDHDGCRFRVLAGFEQGKLTSFSLLATGTGATESCAANIETELTTLYGKPWRQQTGGPISPDAVHADWRDTSRRVVYNAWKLKNLDNDPVGPGFDGKVEVSFFPSK